MSFIRRTIRVGGLSKSELLQRLKLHGVMLNEIGTNLFASEGFVVLPNETTIQVVETTPAELGLPDGGVFEEVIRAAQDRGLSLCPVEVGPYLRLVLMDQAEGAVGSGQTRNTAPPRSLTVMSIPTSTNEDEYRGFYLRRIEGTLWLRGFQSWSGHTWQPQDALIFAVARDAA